MAFSRTDDDAKTPSCWRSGHWGSHHVRAQGPDLLFGHSGPQEAAEFRNYKDTALDPVGTVWRTPMLNLPTDLTALVSVTPKGRWGTSDRDCVPVNSAGSCGFDKYASKAPTLTLDTVCATCSAACGSGETEAVECTSHHDRTCKSSSDNLVGVAGAGGLELFGLILAVVWGVCRSTRRKRRRMTRLVRSLRCRPCQRPCNAVPESAEIFLSHNWGDDELGRDNHDRVVEMNKLLVDVGYATWCDAEQMIGDMVDRMVEGIDNTQVVVAFVTKR